MSLPQIPTSRKAEYLVYLAFSSSIALFIAALDVLPEGLKSLVNTNLALFITITSTGLGGILFTLRMDRAVDWILLRYVKNETRRKEITEFMAQTIVFLRFWEVVPTKIPSLHEQIEDAAKSTIEGEDLHEDVWTQKGIFFLMLSLLMVGLTILLSSTAALYPEVSAVGAGVAFGLPLLLCLAWIKRYEKFPDRCLSVLKFWFFRDQLQTERMMRSRETKPQSKEDAGTPSWMLVEHKDIRWNAEEPSVHKDTLVKHCDEMVKILASKEWIRFEQQLASIKDMLEKTSSRFIKEDALDFITLAWSEILALPENMSTERAEARLDSLRAALEPLSHQDSKLQEVCTKTQSSAVSISTLLSLVEPERLSPTLYKRLGLAIGRSLKDGSSEETQKVSAVVTGWLKGGSKKVLPLLRIMESVDPLVLDVLLESQPLSTDSECARHVLSAATEVPYRDSKSAFPLMARLPKDKTTLDGVVEHLSAAATTDDHEVQLWAMDALGEIGVEMPESPSVYDESFLMAIPEGPSVYDAFSLTLSRKQDDLTMAAVSAASRIGKRHQIGDALVSLLIDILPVRNHYIQRRIFVLCAESGMHERTIPSLLYRVGWTKCGGRVVDSGSRAGDYSVFVLPEKNTGDSVRQSVEFDAMSRSRDVKFLVDRAAASDDATAMKALHRIREEFADSLSDIENIRKLTDAMKRVGQECRRVAIAALIAMYAETVPAEHHLRLAREFLDASKEIADPNIRYLLAYAIGSLGREVQFELARRIQNDDYTVISALSMYHLGDKLGPYAEVVRGIVQGLDKSNSEARTACMLAVTALGANARRFGSLLDKIVSVFESLNYADVACALECLKSVGGPRVHAALGSVVKGLDHWWLRSLCREALQETA